MIFFVLFLINGVIKDDFLVDFDTEQTFQVQPQVAVAPSGHFAVAWRDSIDHYYHSDVRIRFFSPDGEPLGPSVKVDLDTFGYNPRLAADGLGRYVLTWSDAGDILDKVKQMGMRFDSLGIVLSEPFWIDKVEVGLNPGKDEHHDVACNDKGEMVAVWFVLSKELEYEDHGYWIRRYDSSGTEVGEALNVYRPPEWDYRVAWPPSIDLNDEGDVALSWHSAYPGHILFQVLDAGNNLASDSFLIETNYEGAWLHTVSDVRWFDDEHFGLFWLKPANVDYTMINGVQAKLFNVQGDSLSEVTTLLDDRFATTSYTSDPLSISPVHDGRFAVAYKRGFDGPGFRYYRAAGFIADTSLERSTGIFRLASSEPHYYQVENGSAVDANHDRIVWVWQDNSQMREHGDTINIDPYYTDIHCKITDWDLTAIEEPVTHPPVTHLNWEITSAVGSKIVLRYQDCPEGFHAAIYDVSGRQVDELHSSQTQGTISWGECYGPGVYFIRIEGAASHITQKVVLVK